MKLRYLLVGFALVLAGCSAGAPDAPVGVAAGASAGVQFAPVVTVASPPGVPTSISIPVQNVTDEVVPVGLAPDGSMEIPNVSKAGWYDRGPRPGSPGAAVLVGHVDFQGVAGKLGRIGQLKPGDLITVKDAAGIERTFSTYDVRQIPKSQYAAKTVALVFGARTTADLVVVTCSGAVVDHQYLNNTILSAHLVE